MLLLQCSAPCITSQWHNLLLLNKWPWGRGRKYLLQRRIKKTKQTKQTFPLQSSAIHSFHGWKKKVSSHCILWQNVRQRFHSNRALNIPMMLRLRQRLRRSAPTVPRKDGSTPWATSAAFRDVMSVMTASIWKCVPTTALMWKSWWLWPARQSHCVGNGATTCSNNGARAQDAGFISSLLTSAPKSPKICCSAAEKTCKFCCFSTV